MTRLLRALVGFGALVTVVLLASGCANGQPAAPTPDPFAGLADRSDQAFRRGLEAYGQGQYRDALTAFEQARTLSPAADQRIDQMIDRTKAAMAPTPTAVPPTPTQAPVAPTATPVAISQDAADTDLGQRYFGKVSLAMVPGKDFDAPAATQFFFQDQIGLQIEGLKQHLRLPFTLRVFNTDTSQLVAQVTSDDTSSFASQSAAQPSATPAATATPADTTSATPTASQNFPASRFWDTYVWYHNGGEQPGRYRVELYANGILTNTFDYTVGTVPVPTPSTQLSQPAFEAPTDVPAVDTAPPPVAVTQPAAGPAKPSAPSQPAAAPQPTPMPSPTPIPTPATASGTVIGGLPAGLDVDPTNGRVFIADGSGVIWANDPSRPTAFNRPINLGNLPVDLSVDSSTGNVFVSARSESAVVVLDGSGRRLTSIPMPTAPGDLQVDSDLGMVYVALPQSQSLGVVDGRAGRLVRTVEGLPQITSLALDPVRHMLYASHLGGQLSVIDVPSSQVIARVTLTGVGLESVATSRGLAYAINTATHELAVVEPVSQNVSKYVLPAEPAAITASEDSGSVYVLASQPNTVLRIDPSDGTIVGQVILPNRGGRFGISPSNSSAFQGLRSRMVLDRTDESLYVTLPEAGSLSIVPNDLFPPLTRDIPWVQTPDAPIVASIPGVIRPAAPPLPSQPAPVLQAQAPADTQSAITDEEAN
jgi:hypothetical protein